MEENGRVFTGLWIPRDIYLNKEVKWITKVIFLEIHSFTANGKSCYMSNEYMAEFLGISIRQVSRNITTLKKIGWIEETAFDGRKRYLKSCMRIDFNSGEAELTMPSNQNSKLSPNSLDKNVQYIKPIIKQDYNSFKKKKLESPKINANPRKK
jgi:biotin operon repressor